MVFEHAAVSGAIQLTSRVSQSLRSNKGFGGQKTAGSVLSSGYSSLTDVASVARVEPICMIDSDCAYYESIDAIAQSLHSMFTGYYLQAVGMAGTINGVTLAEKLAPFNPNRPAFESLKLYARTVLDGVNPFKFRLPLSTHSSRLALEAMHQVENNAFAHLDDQRKERLKREKIAEQRARESVQESKRAAEKAEREAKETARDDKIAAQRADEKAERAKKEADSEEEKQRQMQLKNGMRIDDKAIDSIREAADLSVGKMINVTIQEDDLKVSVPIAIRLLVNIIPNLQMVDLFTFRDSFDLDMKERWHAVMSGRLSFIKDLILCNDLISKYRRAAIRDKSGLTEQILNREVGHITSSVTGKVSLATATNLAVMSKETLDQIEVKLSGRFSNSQVRKSVFENTNLMILAVIDRMSDMVTFYHRGLETPSTVSIRQLKASNKGGGPDVSDIMKAYMLGNAPQI